jgi:hypothetical protein
MRKLVLSIVAGASAAAYDEDDLFKDINFDDMGDFAEDYLEAKDAGTPEENAKRDFTEFDANGDTQLDPLEIRTRFKGYLNERDLYLFYDSADKDLSGTVSWEEYWQYVNAMQSSP